jgi:myo-inositol-1(or 4)-monophosphatase
VAYDDPSHMTTSAGVTDGELLALAVELVREAGSLLVNDRPMTVSVVATKSSDTDIVTVMDQRIEQLLSDRLAVKRPSDGIMGEEGASRPTTSGIRWIADPIDGTVNYLYDLPGWSVSLAAEVDGVIRVGVVHAPSLGETFTAIRGGGARRNGIPIRCVPDVALDRALVATGFGYPVDRRQIQAEVLQGLLPQVRDIRRLGSAAVDLCNVACGRVDAYYERGAQLWDYAAGALMVTESGGRVSGLNGKEASPQLLLAAGPGLFPQLHDALVALDPERDA